MPEVMAQARRRKGRREKGGREPSFPVTPSMQPPVPSWRQPQLRFKDPERAPAGEFGSPIPNAAVRTGNIPRRGATWDVVGEFALSYDGYAYWDDLIDLANNTMRFWTRDRSLPEGIDELRGCLFYEQRRWHHRGDEPRGRSADYVWALVDAIGASVSESSL
jgi:hypothetical protein